MSEYEALTVGIAALHLDCGQLLPFAQQPTSKGRQASTALVRNKEAIKTLEKMQQKVKAA